MKFGIPTLLGFTVRTSNEYWQRLIIKHPDIEELEELIQLALAALDEVRRSSRDAEVLLFYRMRREERWVVLVLRGNLPLLIGNDRICVDAVALDKTRCFADTARFGVCQVVCVKR